MILVLFSEISELTPISPTSWESLDAIDRDRAFAITHPGERLRFVTGRKLLREAMSQVLGDEAGPYSFLPGRGGKPLLLNGPENIDFSISHSEQAVAVVVSTEGRVGLDIERFHAIDPVSIEAVFNVEELKTMSQLPAEQQAAACIRSFSAKEALLKLRGCPQELDPAAVTAAQLRERSHLKSWTLDFGPDKYQLSLAHEGSADAEVRLRKESA